MSDTHTDPDLPCEIIVLEPHPDGGESPVGEASER
jgi:hypothetical protein